MTAILFDTIRGLAFEHTRGPGAHDGRFRHISDERPHVLDGKYTHASLPRVPGFRRMLPAVVLMYGTPGRCRRIRERSEPFESGPCARTLGVRRMLAAWR